MLLVIEVGAGLQSTFYTGDLRLPKSQTVRLPEHDIRPSGWTAEPDGVQRENGHTKQVEEKYHPQNLTK
jgi:hypothetical protein